MNDQSGDLGGGAMGRLAVLVGEIRSLRQSADQLRADAGVELATQRAELGRQGQQLTELLATTANLLEGVSAIYALLTTPVDEPAAPAEAAATADQQQFAKNANSDASDKPAEARPSTPPYAEH